MTSINWIVLVYKIPSEPTKYRATVWREIKRLGGIYLQNSVCIFPDIDDVALNVSSLANQIRNMGGTEYLFFTTSPTQAQATELVSQFQSSRTEEYQALLLEIDELEQQSEEGAQLANISGLNDEFRRLKKQVALVKARDYFAAPLGTAIATRLQKIGTQILRMSKGT
ncbi:MAG: hypothetical protein A2201_10690 [Alicyclobacillus sp. RIFOXYA1_FULL_53_8]|nr:MAG: hypothetical protein A2201_10690 [Alicyclobacillus sp. RIFOXYA1_FULL_53_8]